MEKFVWECSVEVLWLSKLCKKAKTGAIGFFESVNFFFFGLPRSHLLRLNSFKHQSRLKQVYKFWNFEKIQLICRSLNWKSLKIWLGKNSVKLKSDQKLQNVSFDPINSCIWKPIDFSISFNLNQIDSKRVFLPTEG